MTSIFVNIEKYFRGGRIFHELEITYDDLIEYGIDDKASDNEINDCIDYYVDDWCSNKDSGNGANDGFTYYWKRRKKKQYISDRQRLKNWARGCHFDSLIAVKEVKGKRWMDILSWLEVEFEFELDDYGDYDPAWKKLLECFNRLTDEQVGYLNYKRYNY